MSKITRKIEVIPDIEGLTHDESNKKCYGTFYSFDKNLYKVANLLVSQLYGLDNLLSLMRLQNDNTLNVNPSCLLNLQQMQRRKT